MINDYFGRTAEARKHYEVIVNEESLEMSFRALQVITNFYIRSGEQEKAVALVNKYTDDKLMLDMLNKLANDVRRADPQTTAKIINMPLYSGAYPDKLSPHVEEQSDIVHSKYLVEFSSIP